MSRKKKLSLTAAAGLHFVPGALLPQAVRQNKASAVKAPSRGEHTYRYKTEYHASTLSGISPKTQNGITSMSEGEGRHFLLREGKGWK